MRRIPIIPILLLAFLTGSAWGVPVVRYFGADTTGVSESYPVWYSTIGAAIAASQTTDTLKCIGDYSDTTSAQQNFGAGNHTIDFGGHTVSFPSVPDTDHISSFTSASNVVVKNGTLIITGSGVFYGSGDGKKVFEDLTVYSRGVSGETYLFGTTSATTDSVRFSRCNLYMEKLDGTRVRYPGAATLWYGLLNDCKFSADNCVISGGKQFVVSSITAGSLKGVYIDNCTITKMYYVAVEIQNGGLVELTNTTFAQDSISTGPFFVKTGGKAGVQHDIVVDGCTFDDCMLLVGTSAAGTEAQGGTADHTATVQNCTFTGANTLKNLQIRINYGVATDCVFTGCGAENWNGTDDHPHMVIIGTNAAADVYDNDAGEVITIKDCRFAPTSAVADSSANFFVLAAKTGSFSVYNNEFDMTGLTLPASVNRAAVFTMRSADSCFVYNNTFRLDDGRWIPLALSSQEAGNACIGVEFSNNAILGTYGAGIMDTRWSGMDNYQMTGFVLAANCWSDSTKLVKNDDGAAWTTVVDFSDSTWYASTNFTDSTSWRMKWGGKTGLTGIVANSFGAVNVGVNPPTGSLLLGMDAPYIWPGTHGAEKAIDRVAGTPAELIALIDAGDLPKSDSLNVDTWYRLPQPRSFAEESMCRAYLAAYHDMDEADRIKVRWRVTGARYLLQHPDHANVVGPWNMISGIIDSSWTASSSTDIDTWIELPQARNAADRIMGEYYLRTWQLWPTAIRDAIFFKVDGLTGMNITGYEGDLSPATFDDGIYELLANIGGDIITATDTDIATWQTFDTPRNDAEMLRSQIHLAQWETLAVLDRAKIRLKSQR